MNKAWHKINIMNT